MGLRCDILAILATAVLLAACGGQPDVSSRAADLPVTAQPNSDQGQEYEIVTLLPKDAIPSIDDPTFYSAQEADAEYEADETVIGLEIAGEARAYSTSLLSNHEIVNDQINGRPISVTW